MRKRKKENSLSSVLQKDTIVYLRRKKYSTPSQLSRLMKKSGKDTLIEIDVVCPVEGVRIDFYKKIEKLDLYAWRFDEKPVAQLKNVILNINPVCHFYGLMTDLIKIDRMTHHDWGIYVQKNKTNVKILKELSVGSPGKIADSKYLFYPSCSGNSSFVTGKDLAIFDIENSDGRQLQVPAFSFNQMIALAKTFDNGAFVDYFNCHVKANKTIAKCFQDPIKYTSYISSIRSGLGPEKWSMIGDLLKEYIYDRWDHGSPKQLISLLPYIDQRYRAQWKRIFLTFHDETKTILSEANGRYVHFSLILKKFFDEEYKRNLQRGRRRAL